jgi:hypothetical protein
MLLLGGGCTFLISFDEVPSDDAGVAADAKVEPRPTGEPDTGAAPADSGKDATPAVPVTPACDTTFPLNQVKGCGAFIEGAQICADNTGLTAYPGDRTKDVVTCSKAGATCVRHCAACSRLPEGFPDQCDQCVGKDGKYCGTDMGWQPENFRLLVTCTNSRMSAATACSTKGCDSKGGTGNAACRP